MPRWKIGILWKFLAIIVATIVGVILVVWATIDTLAATYFSTLMKVYNIEPSETHEMFLSAVHRYLLQASLAALVLCLLFSFILTRRMLRPLKELGDVTERIAAGDYGARATVDADDEISALANDFNKMADSLERVDKLRKTMVSDVSQELRTPLTNIRGYLEALSDGVVDPTKETFDLLQREIMRLVRLVEDMTRLASAQGAAVRIMTGQLDLKELVAEIRDLDAPALESRNLKLVTDIPEETRFLRGDRDKVFQVLQNIIQNAQRFSEPGGSILVSASRDDPSRVCVAVTNRGQEIGREALPFIFERFYRADKSRSRKSGGAGIGLAIVKELVEAQGGAVGAESDAGKTRVWFSLPAAA